jgi:hypothetical protein
MGILRKAIAGTGAFMTGGASLALVQFRSDTERNTREIKKLREAVERSGAGSVSGIVVGDIEEASPQPEANLTSYASTDAVTLTQSSELEMPADQAPGWKRHPELEGKECFWNGRKWTSMVR